MGQSKERGLGSLTKVWRSTTTLTDTTAEVPRAGNKRTAGSLGMQPRAAGRQQLREPDARRRVLVVGRQQCMVRPLPPFMLLIHFGVAITFNRYILAVVGLSMV